MNLDEALRLATAFVFEFEARNGFFSMEISRDQAVDVIAACKIPHSHNAVHSLHFGHWRFSAAKQLISIHIY